MVDGVIVGEEINAKDQGLLTPDDAKVTEDLLKASYASSASQRQALKRSLAHCKPER